MAENIWIVQAIAISAIVTQAQRGLPFLVVRRLRTSALARDLSMWMPAGLLVILAVVNVRTSLTGSPSHIAAAATGIGLTIGLHLWRGHVGLSIAGGTVVYMLIVNLIATPGGNP